MLWFYRNAFWDIDSFSKYFCGSVLLGIFTSISRKRYTLWYHLKHFVESINLLGKHKSDFGGLGDIDQYFFLTLTKKFVKWNKTLKGSDGFSLFMYRTI